MDYKKLNREVYDINAEEFDLRTRDYTLKYNLRDAELFVSCLNGKKVLDLGCGPGRDSVFLKEKGLVPICFDLSLGMINLCHEKSLETVLGDLEDLPFEDNSFDGVWAYTSLLHMPKLKLPRVLQKVGDILKPNGVFYMGIKKFPKQKFLIVKSESAENCVVLTQI